MAIDNEFAKIMHNDFVTKATSDMKDNMLTVAFEGDTEVTMSEFEWFKFVGEVADNFRWSIQVMTWHDVNKIITEHVGWTDDSTDDDRREHFFEEGVAQSETWRDPSAAWSPIQLVASLLAESGYFDSPSDMIAWAATAFEANHQFMEALENSNDDDTEVEDE
jgi:hypothetical protein